MNFSTPWKLHVSTGGYVRNLHVTACFNDYRYLLCGGFEAPAHNVYVTTYSNAYERLSNLQTPIRSILLAKQYCIVQTECTECFEKFAMWNPINWFTLTKALRKKVARNRRFVAREVNVWQILRNISTNFSSDILTIFNRFFSETPYTRSQLCSRNVRNNAMRRD